jgi:hypothetical protein
MRRFLLNLRATFSGLVCAKCDRMLHAREWSTDRLGRIVCTSEIACRRASRARRLRMGRPDRSGSEAS